MCYVFLVSVFACATKKILRCTRRALAGCMLRTHHSLRNVSPHRVLIKRYTTEIQVDTQSQEAATFLFLPAPRILHLSPSSPPARAASLVTLSGAGFGGGSNLQCEVGREVSPLLIFMPPSPCTLNRESST